MSHVEIDYTSGTEEEKDAKALADLRKWLGTPQFNNLVKMAKDGTIAVSKGFLRDTFAIVGGVTGRPVEAFIRKYCPDLPERADTTPPRRPEAEMKA